MSKKLQYLSLFTGVGGLDYGLELAGFKNLGCVEIDKDACNVLKQNTKWKIFNEDIKSLNTSELKKTLNIKSGDLDLIVGGPPCQSYSKSSFWNESVKRGYSDSRGKLIDHYMRFVEELLPKVFLIENVPGFCFSEQNGGMKSIQKSLSKITKKNGVKYSISWKILNCVEYGVPQKRERFFLVANRLGKDFVFPEATHAEKNSQSVIEGMKKPFKTPAQAFDGINYNLQKENVALGGKWRELIPCIPPGSNYQYFTDKGKGPTIFEYRSRFWTFLLKLSPHEPSWTIQASPGSSTGPFHWSNRRLYSRELARIQTLPDWVKLSDNLRTNQKLIGNAIPSLMGEVLGNSIKNQIFNQKLLVSYKLLPTEKVRNLKPRFDLNIPSQFLR